MANQNDHLAQAARFIKTIDYLKLKIDEHSEWVATVAFYAALHFIEAAFLTHGANIHSHDHAQRFKTLMNLAALDPKYQADYSNIYKKFQSLYTASSVARYLVAKQPASRKTGTARKVPAEYSSFKDFLSPKDVEKQLLDDCLKTIECTVHSIIYKSKQRKKSSIP